jgi:hypothetical protein
MLTEHDMPVSTRKSNFSDIQANIANILVFAPNFPSRNVTLDGKFEQLDTALGELAARVSNSAVLELLEQCRAQARSSHLLFKAGKEREARTQIFNADDTLRRAGKLRKGKVPTERVEDDYQEDRNPPRPRTTIH